MDQIRDVVVRVNIKAGDMKLPPIDLSNIKQAAAETAKAAAQQADTAKKAADDARKQKSANQDVWAANLKGLEAYGKKRVDMAAVEQELASKRKAAADKQAEADRSRAERQAEHETHIRNRAADLQMRAMEKLSRGIAHVARGIALAFLDGSQDGDKLIETVARIQAGFDSFMGTIEFVSGMAKSIELMGKASEMAAHSNARLAASNLAVDATSRTAAKSVGGFKANLGGAGVEMIALAGIVAGFTALSARTETAAEAEAKKLERLSKAMGELNRNRRFREERQESGLARAGEQSDIDAAFRTVDVVKIEDRQSAIVKTYDAVEKRRNTAAAAAAAAEAKIRDAEKETEDWQDNRKRRVEARMGVMAKDLPSRYMLFASNRNVLRGRAEAVEEGLNTSRQALILRTEQELVQARKDQLEASQKNSEILNRDLATRREITALTKSQSDHAANIYESAKGAYEQEKLRQQSIEAKLGAMTAGQYSRFERARDRATSGNASRKDLEFLQNIAPQFVEKENARRARAEGRTAGALDGLDAGPTGLGAEAGLARLKTDMDRAAEQWEGIAERLSIAQVAEVSVAEQIEAILLKIIDEQKAYKAAIDRIEAAELFRNTGAGKVG